MFYLENLEKIKKNQMPLMEECARYLRIERYILTSKGNLTGIPTKVVKNIKKSHKILAENKIIINSGSNLIADIDAFLAAM